MFSLSENKDPKHTRIILYDTIVIDATHKRVKLC